MHSSTTSSESPGPGLESPAIQLAGTGLRYRVHLEKTSTLKEWMLRRLRRQTSYRDLWALREVNIRVRRGEIVGVIGQNGSGKSTLLKLIAGVLRPTEGAVSVNGSVSALIELGAGFNAELTGRENVYLAGALVGLGRRAMEEKFQGIVEFSELADFMDVPVKNYSSGMYMRLGFACATAVDPEILLIDEILAVGDEAFQQKCVSRIDDFRDRAKTILFVSHDLAGVKKLCSRVYVVHQGRVVFVGPPDEAIAAYIKVLEGDRGIYLVPR